MEPIFTDDELVLQIATAAEEYRVKKEQREHASLLVKQLVEESLARGEEPDFESIKAVVSKLEQTSGLQSSGKLDSPIQSQPEENFGFVVGGDNLFLCPWVGCKKVYRDRGVDYINHARTAHRQQLTTGDGGQTIQTGIPGRDKQVFDTIAVNKPSEKVDGPSQSQPEENSGFVAGGDDVNHAHTTHGHQLVAGDAGQTTRTVKLASDQLVSIAVGKASHDASGPRRQWVCPRCARVYLQARGLRAHQKVYPFCEVLADKPYKCPACSKAYKNTNGLKYHLGHSPMCVPESMITAQIQPIPSASSLGVEGNGSGRTTANYIHGQSMSGSESSLPGAHESSVHGRPKVLEPSTPGPGHESIPLTLHSAPVFAQPFTPLNRPHERASTWWQPASLSSDSYISPYGNEGAYSSAATASSFLTTTPPTSIAKSKHADEERPHIAPLLDQAHVDDHYHVSLQHEVSQSMPFTFPDYVPDPDYPLGFIFGEDSDMDEWWSAPHPSHNIETTLSPLKAAPKAPPDLDRASIIKEQLSEQGPTSLTLMTIPSSGNIEVRQQPLDKPPTKIQFIAIPAEVTDYSLPLDKVLSVARLKATVLRKTDRRADDRYTTPPNPFSPSLPSPDGDNRRMTPRAAESPLFLTADDTPGLEDASNTIQTTDRLNRGSFYSAYAAHSPQHRAGSIAEVDSVMLELAAIPNTQSIILSLSTTVRNISIIKETARDSRSRLRRRNVAEEVLEVFADED